MAGGLSANIAAIFAKTESTYKTDPTPVGTDGMLVSNLSVVPYQGRVVSRDFIRSYYGASSEINVGPHVQVDFDIEIAGGGAAATQTPWARLLEACNFTETTASPIVSYSYSPNSTAPSSQNSVTIYAEFNGETQVIVGCRGNVRFNFDTGQIPKMSFTFLGIYAKPTASSITADYSAFQSPVPVTDSNTGTLTIDSYAFAVEQLNWDMGNQVAYRNVVNDEKVVISDRNARGTVSFEAELLATKDVFALIESHSTVSTAVLDMIHNSSGASPDTNAGSVIEVDMPAVQLSNLRYGESDGIRMYTCDMILTPSSGNDELTIITR